MFERVSTLNLDFRIRESPKKTKKCSKEMLSLTLLLIALFLVGTIVVAEKDPIKDEMVIQYASRNDVSGLARTVREGGSIDARDEKSGQTALMRAILSGQTSAVFYLLKHGARTDVAEKDGYTPMHAAAFQGRAEIARMLIKHGLDPREMHFDKVRGAKPRQ